MPINVKELIVILALSTGVFALGKSAALHFMDSGDFKRRRNVWLILSAAAFLSPSFWIFTLVAAPTLYWGGKKDTNPLAFFLVLMNVIPSIQVPIPTGDLGINQLFDLNIFRLLSIFVLVPAARQLRKSSDWHLIRGLQTTDLLLTSYGILTVVLYVSPDLPNHVILHNSFTNTLRDAFLFLIDIYIVYYVASRSFSNHRAMMDALAGFCLSCTIMASVAVFESLKHWLLYTELVSRWGGNVLDQAYAIREGALRAEASSGNPIVLGCLLAIGFGFWLYLKTHIKARGTRITVTTILLLGLLASASRGPWLGAIIIYFSYAAIRPGGISGLLKSALACIFIGGLILASPIGDKVANVLPFIGGKTADSSLIYRERLVERSWQLILAHPILGDQQALSQMQDLRQGQGIIDVVNTYVGVTLFYGFTGLIVFLAFILLALFEAQRAARSPPSNPNFTPLGTTLSACILGLLVMLGDCGFDLGNVPMFLVLAGLSVSCSRLKQTANRGLQASSLSPELPCTNSSP